MTRPVLKVVPAIVLASLAAMPAIASAQNVAMFRGNATRSGNYNVEPVRAFGGLQWRFVTGGAVRSTPAVTDEAVFVGSGDGHVYAIDRWTGDEIWRFPAGAAVTSSPAVSAAAVFFTSRDNAIHAVSRATGEPLWRRETGPDRPWKWGHESADLWTSSPVLSDGLVIVGSGDGHVYALEEATGAVRWTAETEGRVRSSPAVRGGRVYVGSMDGRLYVLDVRTGQATGHGVTEGANLFSGDFGFDRTSIQSTPAVTGQAAYVGSKDGFVYAFSPLGQLVWRFDHTISWILGGPAVGDGRVYAGSSDAKFVHALSMTTPTEQWRHTTEGIVWGSPTFAKGVLYFGDGAGVMTALDAASGAVLWKTRASARIWSSPVPADNALFFGSDDGAVYAIRGAPEPLKRVVFHDSTVGRLSYFSGADAVADYLAGAGYERLDSAALGAWLAARSRDRAPSVVVFAHDRLPENLVPRGGSSPLTTYLEAGGKVVWAGVPPLMRRVDATGKAPELLDSGWDATSAFLGVDHSQAIFDPFSARPSAEGRRWGLSGWWLTRWAARAGGDVTALALDENGLAPLWVRSFGGAPGTGFVRIWADPASTPDVGLVQAAAEYLPLGRP